MELCRGDSVDPVLPALFGLIARCIASEHFQVAERALMLWSCESLGHGLLSKTRAPMSLPLLFSPLMQASTRHWNESVLAAAESVLQRSKEQSPQVYESCLRTHNERKNALANERACANAKWVEFEKAAASTGSTEVSGSGPS